MTLTEPEPAQDARISILMVDDRTEHLLALEVVLADFGLRLVRATSGAEALRYVLDEEFAVIILDVQMPIMDGFEVARLIKTRDRSRHVPIIFVSAVSRDIESAYRGYEVGAVDFILKPLNPHVVRAKVAVFVELHRQREEIRRQAERDRALEIERAARAEAEKAVMLRDEFLSIASHELRTPLSALELQVQSLQVQIERTGGAPDRLPARVEIIARQVDRLSRLITQLLDVSRIRVGRLELDREEIELAEVAREVAARFAGELDRSGSEIVLDLPEGVMGFWDRSRLDQVVTNLLLNAIKYGGGKPITIALWHDGDSARLAIEDRGIGISAEDQRRIFGRFERAVSSRQYGGMGVGLFIVDQIVRAHGGEIAVRSALGEGATFVVRLPINRAPP
jgi:signal transduction histidine kinase